MAAKVDASSVLRRVHDRLVVFIFRVSKSPTCPYGLTYPHAPKSTNLTLVSVPFHGVVTCRISPPDKGSCNPFLSASAWPSSTGRHYMLSSTSFAAALEVLVHPSAACLPPNA
ncbi:hypothetical protein FIBSPDRAFT_1043951 [Athelia psychrophila]|uniref:Uncharacterized protein n=1 Tax=Athelia psychrophila TaxID=1759441 RepID=A0A166KGL6_9AGAM|nr:hypothetical protein FIBSPDRAFT_1043951 [Fibularhizoctonia sp. CBS 109695]